jgi:hypothetical protein
VVSTKALRRSVIGQVSYNSSTGIIHRGYNDVLLSTQREKLVFEHLFSVAAADETFVSAHGIDGARRQVLRADIAM